MRIPSVWMTTRCVSWDPVRNPGERGVKHRFTDEFHQKKVGLGHVGWEDVGSLVLTWVGLNLQAEHRIVHRVIISKKIYFGDMSQGGIAGSYIVVSPYCQPFCGQRHWELLGCFGQLVHVFVRFGHYTLEHQLTKVWWVTSFVLVFFFTVGNIYHFVVWLVIPFLVVDFTLGNSYHLHPFTPKHH